MKHTIEQQLALVDRIAGFLAEQGEKSMDDDGHCVYRGPAGRKCGIGCLITDEAYTAGLEGQGVFDLPVIRALVASGIDIADDRGTTMMLTDAQRIHDRWSPDEWAEAYARLRDVVANGMYQK